MKDNPYGANLIVFLFPYEQITTTKQLLPEPHNYHHYDLTITDFFAAGAFFCTDVDGKTIVAHVVL